MIIQKNKNLVNSGYSIIQKSKNCDTPNLPLTYCLAFVVIQKSKNCDLISVYDIVRKPKSGYSL